MQVYEWKPIEDAPRDGTIVWALFKDDIFPKIKLEGNIVTDDGRSLSSNEVIQVLLDDQAKGYKIWCGCDNRDSDGRCAGHEA